MSSLLIGPAWLFMVFDKLPAVGHRLIRRAGAALIVASLAVAVTLT